MWGSAAAVNVRRQDDGPARGQASLGPRIARTVLACALVAGGDAAVVWAGTTLGPGPLRDAALFVVLASAGLWVGAGHAPALLAGARTMTPPEAPMLQSSLRVLADRGGVRVPRLDLSPAREPIAFTTGRARGSARITVSTGLFALLDDDEVEAVLAREVARTCTGATFAATFAQLVSVTAVLAGRVVVGRRRRTPRVVALPARCIGVALLAGDAKVDALASRLLPHGDSLDRARRKLDATRGTRSRPSASTVARALVLLEARRRHAQTGVTDLTRDDELTLETHTCTRAPALVHAGVPRLAGPRR